MSKEVLVQAQELIKNKQFDQAAALLQTIGDNPTAKEWLARIAQMRTATPSAPTMAAPAPQMAMPHAGADDDVEETYHEEYVPPNRKVQWEYCTIEQSVSTLTNSPMYRVEIYDPNGRHNTMADSDFTSMTQFNPVFKQLLAQMGLEGWELVQMDSFPDNANRRMYWFKRLVEHGA